VGRPIAEETRIAIINFGSFRFYRPPPPVVQIGEKAIIEKHKSEIEGQIQ